METLSGWISDYGYVGLSVLLALGIVGLPVPDETLLTFAGYLIYKHQLSLGWTVTAAFAGSLTGITVSYILGRSIGLYLLHKYGKYIFVTQEKLNRVHDWFERKGKWTLTIGYFIPGVRHLTAYTAGASKLRVHEFALFAWSGGILWSLTFILLGYSLGDQWESVIDRFQQNVFIGSCVVLGIVLAVWLARAYLRGRQSGAGR